MKQIKFWEFEFFPKRKDTKIPTEKWQKSSGQKLVQSTNEPLHDDYELKLIISIPKIPKNHQFLPKSEMTKFDKTAPN